MSLVLLLFLLGVVLLGLEVFAPGAILGVMGGLSMFGGCIAAFVHFGLVGGTLATLAGAALLGLTLYAEFKLLPHTRVGRQMLVQTANTSTSQPFPAEAAEVVGKMAEALTTLAPSGYVAIDGKRYEAFSRDGHVTAGTKLRVVGVDNFRLIVTSS